MNNLYRATSNCQKNRGTMSPHKNKINFMNLKNNTMCSLNEVEYFLNNFSHFLKYVKLYKIINKL